VRRDSSVFSGAPPTLAIHLAGNPDAGGRGVGEVAVLPADREQLTHPAARHGGDGEQPWRGTDRRHRLLGISSRAL